MIKTATVTPEQVAAFEAQQARIREQMGFAEGVPVSKAGPLIIIQGPLDAQTHERIKLAAIGKQVVFDTLPAVQVRNVTTQDVEDGVLAVLQPATAMLLRLVIAYDGSLAAALSRAIVARAEQVGLAKLVDVRSSQKQDELE